MSTYKLIIKKILKTDNNVFLYNYIDDGIDNIVKTFFDLLLNKEINIKNKLYGWANKNGKLLEFDTLEEKFENGRRLFTIGATVDGELVAEGKGYNKKDASQVAAQLAVDKLGL